MEGALFKWTNYYNGWQLRYFVLDERGVLSYYKSKDLIDQGCKGSCLVDVCQLKVHPHDSYRFDLIIPGEHFICLKAKSQSERQQWLLSIGTSKSRGNKSPNTRNQLNEQKSSINVSNINSVDQELKIKIQELRLYETVLMQGIHNIKSLANDSPTVDIQKLDQSTSMLGVTCDVFVQTLDECLKLAKENSSKATLPTSLTNRTIEMSSQQENLSVVESNPSPNKSSNEILYRTFFSELSSTFSQFEPLEFRQIHSETFLSTCEQYFFFFDKFPSPTFIPLRADIQGNISKIRRKMSNDRTKFQCLSSIIGDEISSQTTREKNSATDAILWLKRTLNFLAYFLHEFGKEKRSVEDTLNNAYRETLKAYHGWITRGIFSIAFRSVPYYDEFLRSLHINRPNEINENLFREQICNEMIEHSQQIRNLVRKMTQFYIQHQLESNEIIG